MFCNEREKEKKKKMYNAIFNIRDGIKSFGKFAMLYLYKIGGGGPEVLTGKSKYK